MVWFIFGIYILVDPCMDFRCKRGKACMLDADLKPACVCQEPTKCPASVNEFDHVSSEHLIHKFAPKSRWNYAYRIRPKSLTWQLILFVCCSSLLQVCGTNNKTYDTACALFATKCNLEGTKRGHKLHLDYTGPCKCMTSQGFKPTPCFQHSFIQHIAQG